MIYCPHCEHELTPHEIGVLFARLGKRDKKIWGAKLTRKDADHIRKLKEPIRDIAEKYNVSFVTIWRIKNDISYTGENDLNCPYCKYKIQPDVIAALFATLGGQKTSPVKAKNVVAALRRRAKLTQQDADDIRKSKALTKELAKKYNVSVATITSIRRNETWKTKS